MSAQLELAEWLVSAAAAPWLRQAAEEWRSAADSLRVLTGLRRKLDPARAAGVLQQIELRSRATAKFARASAMFFTPQGLEQASGEALARYKARRLATGAPLADLCCGIGGDAVEFAARGPGTLIDRDPVAVCFAVANCQQLGTGPVEGIVSATESLDPHTWSTVHIDPDRRPPAGRTTTLDWCSPALDELQRWVDSVPALALKLAPASDLPTAWQSACEREWLGLDRECKQQVAWFGRPARHPGRRVATVVHRNETWDEFVEPAEEAQPQTTRNLGSFLVEPHAAVRAAGLTGPWAAVHGYRRLSDNPRLLVAEDPYIGGIARSFQVLTVVAPRPLELHSELKQLAAAKPEVKGANVPAGLAGPLRGLPAYGSQPVTLVLLRLAGAWRCAVTLPCGTA